MNPAINSTLFQTHSTLWKPKHIHYPKIFYMEIDKAVERNFYFH